MKNKKQTNKKTPKIYIKKGISKFKCNKVSVLIILVFVPQLPILEMVP
jgi:hypothetical protein